MKMFFVGLVWFFALLIGLGGGWSAYYLLGPVKTVKNYVKEPLPPYWQSYWADLKEDAKTICEDRKTMNYYTNSYNASSQNWAGAYRQLFQKSEKWHNILIHNVHEYIGDQETMQLNGFQSPSYMEMEQVVGC